MTKPDRARPLQILVCVLGLGLLAAGYAVWTLKQQFAQEQQVVTALLARDAEKTQALSDQQRLVQGLQAQVLKLGGKPLLTAPPPPQPAPSPGSSEDAPATRPSPAAQHPSATPGPTPRPTGSPTHSPTPKPSPTPSPSPTCRVKVGPVCL